jgi:hypothetical protein
MEAEVLGVQDGSFIGQTLVYVDWPTRRETTVDAYLHFTNGRYDGNSGNIPQRWLAACKRAALQALPNRTDE